MACLNRYKKFLPGINFFPFVHLNFQTAFLLG